MTDNAPRPAWFSTLAQHAASAGEDPEVLWRIAMIESSGGINNEADTSSARGPFQFTEGTFSDLSMAYPSLGLTDRSDFTQSAIAAPYHARSLRNAIAKSQGKAPSEVTPVELYAGWFAGIGGGPKLLKADPSLPIDQVLDADQFAANERGFRRKGIVTVGDWLNVYKQEMGDDSFTPRQPTPKVHASGVSYLAPVPVIGVDERRAKELDATVPELRDVLFQLGKKGREIGIPDIKVISGYRDEAQNEAVGGASGSRHLHKDAVDLDLAGYTDEQKKAVIATLLADPRVGAIGNYGGDTIHFDLRPGGRKAWGPNKSSSSLGETPSWFRDQVTPWLGQKRGAAPVSDTSTAFVTRETDVPMKPNGMEALWTQQEEAQARDAYSFAGGLWEATKRESSLYWMFDASERPDPNWNGGKFVMEDSKRLDEMGVPAEMRRNLIWSNSKADYDRVLRNIMDEMEYEKKIGAMGMTGTALRLFGSMVDPAGIALAMVSPTGALMNKSSKAARILGVGLEGAAANVALDLPQYAQRPGFSEDQLLYSAAFGFAVGGAVGGVFRPTDNTPELRAMEKAARSVMGDIEQKYLGRPGDAGAAAASNVGTVKMSTTDFLTDEFDAANPKTAYGYARWDLGGAFGRSDVPLVRAAGGSLVEDAVGKADGSINPRAVSMEANKLNLQSITWTARVYKTAWDDYVTRNNIGWFGRNEAEAKFRQQIADVAEEYDPARLQGVDPAVMKMAQFNREWMKRWHEIITNPGFLDGTQRKALLDIPENPYYVPHLPNMDKFGRLVSDIGDDREVQKLIRESILAELPDLEFKIATKAAKSYYESMRKAQVGTETNVGLKLSGYDTQLLREELRAVGQMTDDEIESFLRAFSYREEGKEGPVRYLKRRQSLKVDHAVPIRFKDGSVREVRVKDWMERDIVKLHHMYSRTMSARVALARMQIENPRWRAGDPDAERFLVDGIYSEADWGKLLASIKDAADAKAREVGDPEKALKIRKQTENNIERMQWVYDMLTGKQEKWDKGAIGSIIRTLRDYNFMRVMNQVGFAQLPELATAASQVGIKAAYRAMPSFRTFMRSMKTGELEDDIAREIEWVATPGTDALRANVFNSVDDFGNVVQESGRLAAVEGLARKGADITAKISGMQAINVFLQRWAGKMVVAKFANSIDKDVNKTLNLKRLATMGIDEAKANAILSEMKKNATFIGGERDGSTIRRLNLENWDPKVRYDFEYAVFAWTRKMIQENDIGQTNTVLGSTIGRLITQFRSFMFGAYTKQTLHNLHVGGLNPFREGNSTFETYSMMMATTFFGALTYMSQTYLQSLGREDQQEFLTNRFGEDYEKVALAAFQRSGWTSIFPFAVDNMLYLGGQDPLFDTRASGQPSQGLFSNPTVNAIDGVMRATRGITGFVTGSTGLTDENTFTQKDARAVINTLPFANFLPFVSITNLAVSNLPEKELPK